MEESEYKYYASEVLAKIVKNDVSQAGLGRAEFNTNSESESLGQDEKLSAVTFGQKFGEFQK